MKLETLFSLNWTPVRWLLIALIELPFFYYGCAAKPSGVQEPAQMIFSEGHAGTASIPSIPTGAAVLLAWNPSPNATAYKIYYGTAPHFFDNAVVSRASEQVLMGLPFDVQYFASVTAFDDAGDESDYSAEVYFTTSQQSSRVMRFFSAPADSQAELSADLKSWALCAACRAVQTNEDNSQDWYLPNANQAAVFYRLTTTQ